LHLPPGRTIRSARFPESQPPRRAGISAPARQFAAKPGRFSGERAYLRDEALPQFALGKTPKLNAPAMWTSTRARSLKARSLQTGLIAGLLGLAPLAASTAATPSESALPVEAAAASAEIVPLQQDPLSEPLTDAASVPPEAAPVATSLGSGTASYYGRKFHGRRTASGEAFDMGAMTAAHRSLPFGSLVRVTNPANGKSVTVRINDRGPFSRGRVIDVSRAAAEELGLIARGHGTVELELIEG